MNFCGMPIYTLKVLGPQQVPLEARAFAGCLVSGDLSLEHLKEMSSIAVGGSRCLFFAEDFCCDVRPRVREQLAFTATATAFREFDSFLVSLL